MSEFIDYQECPRCGFMAYERLSTHSYCADCNYSPDFSDGVYQELPDWVIALSRPQTPAAIIPPLRPPKLAA